MKTFDRIVFVAMILLAVAFAGALRYGRAQRAERTRLEHDRLALLEESRQYRVRDSLNAATIGVLTLRNDEFKKYHGELHALVRDMGLRLARVESLSQATLRSRYEITAPVTDTLVPRDPVIPGECAPALAIRYRSPHITLDGVIRDETFHGTIATYDTITQVVHRIPRRFLFITWGTKGIRQEMLSSNPHTHITYQTAITLKRRK